jgi:hypothetical protein
MWEELCMTELSQVTGELVQKREEKESLSTQVTVIHKNSRFLFIFIPAHP